MVKVYFTYKFHESLGHSISKNCNFIYTPASNQLICGVNQYVNIISCKTGQIIRTLTKPDKNVPVRFIHYRGGKIYAGFQDGEIIVWDSQGQLLSSLDLHKATVSWISSDQANSKLISGALDGSIMIWDLLSEECHTIKGAHPSPITQLETAVIMIKNQPTPVLFSIGKDGFFRVWNLVNNLCIFAVSCQVTEAYSMYYDSSRNLVYVGTNKQDIVIIEINDGQDMTRLCSIRSTFKKKSFARTMQIFVELGYMHIINSDKTMEKYSMLTGKDLEARKKRLINRRKKGQQDAEVQVQETEAELKFVQQKVIPFKFYNAQVYEHRILLNNGTNVYQLESEAQVTQGIGCTQQLCLQYPFLLQRSQTSVNVYSSNTSEKLFCIPVKADWCAIFSGSFAMITSKQHVGIWSLARNEEVFKLEEKWSGCWVKGTKALLWRENQLGIFQIGYDKNKSIRMKVIQIKKFEDKITEAAYKHRLDKYVVCLQSSQVIINHADSHKQFLKLYGHKLPINSFSLSTDDSILATGSIDKDIRLWDMDFGHSIKTIFAHQEAVTIVQFVPETHYLFSGGKDGHIKFWDMDTHQLIMDFEQCTMEIRGLAISASGDFMAAGGLDQGFRIWKQTNDQTIASDMQEKQMQKMMIEDYAKEKLDQKEQKTRYEDLKHGEQIIEALENKQCPKTLIGMIKRIPAANLKSCLSFLHERHIRRLEQYVKYMIGGSYEQQTSWRVIREVNKGSELGKRMRNIWKPVQNLVIVNTEILKTILKQVEQEDQYI